jgi:multisubunit Na+/H+ antiporter MnhE subunit
MEEKNNQDSFAEYDILSLKNLLLGFIIALPVSYAIELLFDFKISWWLDVIMIIIFSGVVSFVRYYNSDEAKRDWLEEIERRKNTFDD